MTSERSDNHELQVLRNKLRELETQLEKERKEKEFWRDVAREYMDTVNEQNVEIQNVETARNLEEVLLSSTGFPAMLTVWDWLLKGRARYQRLVQELLRAIELVHRKSKARVESVDRWLETTEQVLKETIEQRGQLSANAEVVLVTAMQLQKVAAETAEETLAQIEEAVGGGELAVVKKQLIDIIRNEMLASAHLYESQLITYAARYDEDPRVICAHIMFECRQFGKTTMETVQQLDLEWLADQLSDKMRKSEIPSKHETLLKNLNIAHDRHEFDGSNSEFVDYLTQSKGAEAPGERQLRIYNRLYKEIASLARTLYDLYDVKKPEHRPSGDR